jgi:phenylalanyl-tRNA synthetase beta chain
LIAAEDPIVSFNRSVSDYLVGQRFNECVNYTLRAAKEVLAWTPSPAATQLALANPFVEDQSHLRSTLIAGLLESLKLNRSRGVAATRLFETGRVFIERNGQTCECVAVGFITAEDPSSRAWLRREPDDFYSVKRHVETVAASAGVDLSRQPLMAVADSGLGWQAGHSAAAGEIQHGWTARFGLLDLSMIKSLGLDGKVYAGFFAILPEKLSTESTHRRFQPFGLYPAALRDLALIVDESNSAAEVQKSLTKLARAAVGQAFGLESVTVFDVYRGKGLPEGKKSLAFSLTFRAPDRTLTDHELNAFFKKIQDELVKTTAFQIRK